MTVLGQKNLCLLTITMFCPCVTCISRLTFRDASSLLLSLSPTVSVCMFLSLPASHFVSLKGEHMQSLAHSCLSKCLSLELWWILLCLDLLSQFWQFKTETKSVYVEVGTFVWIAIDVTAYSDRDQENKIMCFLQKTRVIDMPLVLLLVQ